MKNRALENFSPAATASLSLAPQSSFLFLFSLLLFLLPIGVAGGGGLIFGGSGGGEREVVYFTFTPKEKRYGQFSAEPYYKQHYYLPIFHLTIIDVQDLFKSFNKY